MGGNINAIDEAVKFTSHLSCLHRKYTCNLPSNSSGINSLSCSAQTRKTMEIITRHHWRMGCKIRVDIKTTNSLEKYPSDNLVLTSKLE